MINRKIAVFDFDGTITKRDTLLPFIASYGLRNIFRAVLKTLFQKKNKSFRDTMKGNLIRTAFKGCTVEKFLIDGIKYAEQLKSRFRPDTLKLITEHKGKGHELVMVTASLATYTCPVGASLGFDHVIAVELEDMNGSLTGEMKGANVRGMEKARLLREWLGGETAEIWGYGNSRGDKEMLTMADHQVWV